MKPTFENPYGSPTPASYAEPHEATGWLNDKLPLYAHRHTPRTVWLVGNGEDPRLAEIADVVVTANWIMGKLSPFQSLNRVSNYKGDIWFWFDFVPHPAQAAEILEGIINQWGETAPCICKGDGTTIGNIAVKSGTVLAR